MSNSVRVLPLLVVAGLCLFALKAMGLLFSGGYVVSGVAPAKAQNPEASKPAVQSEPIPAKPLPQEGKPAEENSDDARPGVARDDETAKATQVAAAEASKDDPVQGSDARKDASGGDVTKGPIMETPKSELAVLEGLANRRKELDKREKKIDLRENLLKAAEKRVEARIAELKSIEAKIESKLKKQDKFRKAQYENLVKMYSAMKPKDAARIFNRMELDVLTGMAIQMKPRVMSAIMAKMDPAAAERLTLEIATRGKSAPQKPSVNLPKIESEKSN